jgi:hypothetical protein
VKEKEGSSTSVLFRKQTTIVGCKVNSAHGFFLASIGMYPLISYFDGRILDRRINEAHFSSYFAIKMLRIYTSQPEKIS